MAGVEQVLHAIRLGEQFPLIKGIDVYLGGRGLITHEKMSRHSNPGDRQTQPACDQKINQAKRDGISRPAIQHTIQVTIVRLVIILLVAMEFELAKKVLIDPAEQ